MKERPILFSGVMVRAILNDRKTQTRRILKPTVSPACREEMRSTAKSEIIEWREQNGRWFGLHEWETLCFADCPYGLPGDRLWVRETCSFTVNGYPNVCKPSIVPHDAKVWYREANDRPTWAETKWHPSIFMPRWASRITLEIADVRIERLWDMTEHDAMAEGCEDAPNPDFDEKEPMDESPFTFKAGFMKLWSEINGLASWYANPWVWVIEFKRLKNAT